MSRDIAPVDPTGQLSNRVVAIGFDRADPLIGLAITAVILRITWQAWRTIRNAARLGRAAGRVSDGDDVDGEGGDRRGGADLCKSALVDGWD